MLSSEVEAALDDVRVLETRAHEHVVVEGTFLRDIVYRSRAGVVKVATITNAADADLIVALVNAYTRGQLVESAELERLMAIEAAAKETEDALAFIINHVDIPDGWYVKFCGVHDHLRAELERSEAEAFEGRTAICDQAAYKARAENAELALTEQKARYDALVGTADEACTAGGSDIEAALDALRAALDAVKEGAK
jgi:hypothetical protein